jgi:hypothetical protein
MKITFLIIFILILNLFLIKSEEIERSFKSLKDCGFLKKFKEKIENIFKKKKKKMNNINMNYGEVTYGELIETQQQEDQQKPQFIFTETQNHW